MGKKKSKSTNSPATRSNSALQEQLDSAAKRASKDDGTANFKPAAEEEHEDHLPRTQSFPVVGIGASAGGLEAFKQLLDHLPADTGMAFVLVQHLDPKHASILTELLSKTTYMPVTEVKDGMAVEPNCVYVIPPNTDMAIFHYVLNLLPRTQPHGKHMPIDYFLHSLVKDLRSQAIGVILSGTASDGTLGLKAIKAEGGITFAQDEKSAKFEGMPHNAIATGCVDFILPPEGIAKELVRISQHPYVADPTAAKKDNLLPEGENNLNKIFILLRSATGVDFTYYKFASIKRRIVRRMVLNKIETLQNYIRFLQENPPEVDALYQDILIKVTGFFRDPVAFQVLMHKVFPEIIKNRVTGAPIRVWVPGCASGEEPYSIVISLLEFLGDMGTQVPVQVFATDLSEGAIGKARVGIYPETISLDVSPERLQRFFVKIDGGYQINKTIRDMCVFAKQDVTRDPPFSRLDLISCRNMLIYLGPVLQKKVIPIFHYALKATGFLMLGTSETIGRSSDLFALLDRVHKIYSRKSIATRLHFDFVVRDYATEKVVARRRGSDAGEDAWVGLELQKEADRILLNRYAPAGVVINDDLDIVQFRGHTGFYLESAPGAASLNLLKMAREGLLLELRTAIHKAKKQDSPVKKTDLRVKYNDQFRTLNVEVIPIEGPPSRERFYLVLFEDVTSAAKTGSRTADSHAEPQRKAKGSIKDHQIAQLMQELAATKEYMQSIIEEQEAQNEELRSANEEIESSNEELQSTNEELETAREELQSTNEELTTVNEELQNRDLEMTQVNNDLNNLLESANIPIVVLGQDMRIRRFTLKAEKMLNLIPTDIGRPISDININIACLEPLILEVVGSLSARELEVQDREGRWYSMRIRPYKTAENKIEGAILSLLDIDELKRKSEQLKESRNFSEAIVETVQEPLIVLDPDLRVKKANPSFYRTFQVMPAETEGRFIYDLGDGQWNIPALRLLLEEILTQNTHFFGFKVEHEFPGIGPKTMVLNARRLCRGDNSTQMILLAFDVQLQAPIKNVNKPEVSEAQSRKLSTFDHEIGE